MGRSQVEFNRRTGRGRGKHENREKKRQVIKGENSWRYVSEEVNVSDENDCMTDNVRNLLAEGGSSYMNKSETSDNEREDFMKGDDIDDFAIDGAKISAALGSLPTSIRLNLPSFIADEIDALEQENNKEVQSEPSSERCMKILQQPPILETKETKSTAQETKSTAQETKSTAQETIENDSEDKEDLDAWLDSIIS